MAGKFLPCAQDAASKLELKAIRQLEKFEGKKKRSTSKTYRALSSRICAYKRTLIGHLPSSSVKLTPGFQRLCTLDELGYKDGKPIAPGTANISTFARIVQAVTGSPSKQSAADPTDDKE